MEVRVHERQAELDDTNLRVILRVAGMESNGFEVQTAVQIDRGHNVLKSRDNSLDSSDVLLLKGEWRRG